MKKRILVVATILAMVAVGSFTAHAAPMPKMPGHMDGKCPPPGPGPDLPRCGPEQMAELLGVALDLDDAQKVRMQSILDDDRTHQEKLAKELRDGERALHRLLDADAFDEQAFRTLGMEMAQKRLDMMMAGPRLKSRLLAMLDDQQQGKAEKLLKLMTPPPPPIEGKPGEEKTL